MTYAETLEFAKQVEKNHKDRAFRESLLLEIMKRKAAQDPFQGYQTLCHESMQEADLIASAFKYAVEIEDQIRKHTDEFPND